MTTRIYLKILSGILILFVTLWATTYFILHEKYPWLLLLLPVLLLELAYIFRQQKKGYVELNDFIEAVRYRDFSRMFNVSNAPVELRNLRKGFNEINNTFRTIANEKETQYQYLQKIMEMVNTGILSYNTETLEVQWANESLKQMLQIPYLKSITSLEKRNKELYQDIISLQPGETKITTLYVGLATTKILLTATAFQTGQNRYALIGFQNINNALDETESEAWRKLLRVLTHEIMNSVAPISSLADTLQHRLQHRKDSNEPGREISLDDIQTGIDTIKKRSESLLRFAETYRSLNKISAPDIQRFFVCDLFENITNLMEPTLEQKEIELDILLKDPGLQLDADRSLIEQVLINLVVNAIDALKERDEKRITLSAERIEENILLRVSDNGAGMSPEILDKIFIPFFSTKKSGSGIGLSLCRQIMRAHHGNLQVVSEEGKGSVFTLRFSAAE